VTSPDVVTEPFPRVRPKITERNGHFWQGGADGLLRLLRCQSCGTYLHPDMEPPYVVAEVDLVEQGGLRLMTNIVDCPLDEVRTGMEVQVVFARHDDVYIPLFRPVAVP
jgi:uncharacterized protein